MSDLHEAFESLKNGVYKTRMPGRYPEDVRIASDIIIDAALQNMLVGTIQDFYSLPFWQAQYLNKRVH